ncbi:MAG TPA: MarC family protein [Verrucomicrobiae bacterium]|nr:MarC family protein [Verrucomicrobiae bacterium]
MQFPLGLWSAFVTLLVTIGPVDTAAVFTSLTKGVHHRHRKGLAARAVLAAGSVLLVFAVAGNLLLALLGVSLPAFQVAGGILLFLQALTLSFSKSGLSSISEGEHREAEKPGDIAVFPLAFPLIAGPGSLSAVVLLMGRVEGIANAIAILVLLSVCLAITFMAMLVSDGLERLLGETGTDVVGRISGVLLAALAVQFVFEGLRQAAL